MVNELPNFPAKQSTNQVDEQSSKRPNIFPRNQQAIDLIDDWLADDSGHDERFWPILHRELEQDRLRCRE